MGNSKKHYDIQKQNLMSNICLSIIFVLLAISCKDFKNNNVLEISIAALDFEKVKTIKLNSIDNKVNSISDFLPKGFIISDSLFGHLNKDSLEDCILKIKATNPNNMIFDENRGELDRNRRGIIILFKTKEGYELACKNYNCFSSENEDGGGYFPPELSLNINKRNLYVLYQHGRYGFWTYTFRFQKGDFELIGFDSSDNQGPVINKVTSINYLTKRKVIKLNTNENAEGGDEIFKQIVTKFNVSKPIKLSEIEDFDKLDVTTE
jgi:hypothetical protein